MKFTKILVIALLFGFMQTAFAQEKAEMVIANAQKKAKAENKNVMVFFSRFLVQLVQINGQKNEFAFNQRSL